MKPHPTDPNEQWLDALSTDEPQDDAEARVFGGRAIKYAPIEKVREASKWSIRKHGEVFRRIALNDTVEPLRVKQQPGLVRWVGGRLTSIQKVGER